MVMNMNLMERNPQEDKKDWRDDIKPDMHTEQDGLPLEDLDREHDAGEEEAQGGLSELLQKPYMTPVLLGVIAVLIICIIVLLLFSPRRKEAAQTSNSDLQQDITQYAQQQKQNDYVAGLSGETVSVSPSAETAQEEDAAEAPEQATETTLEAADGDKTAIVVDVEDENDVSYSKEFILNEALPYFADNNQEAIWDLAHLKRYVKLSEGLKGTDQYYYNGDVNSDGRPDGQGLAIYEDNSYYYGDWVDGVRSGRGTWYKFYIGRKNKTNAMGKYMAHSYSGTWADNLPDGDGAEHYDVDITKLKVRERILQNVVGNFSGGLYDGELYANTVDNTGNVEEWNGVAEKGVFTLWRDMSAIGECSVWRKKDDPSLCMDIDQSENQNQGIRELLKTGTK